MFGTLRPHRCSLSPSARQQHRHLYCGLCKTMGEDYGQLSRVLVSFDAVLLGAVVEGLQEIPTQGDRCRCPINPLVHRPTLRHDSVTMRFSAAAQVLLADQWVADRAEEGDRIAALLRPVAAPFARSASATFAGFGAPTELLDALPRIQQQLEQQHPPPMQAAQPTADALTVVFRAIPDLPGVIGLDGAQRLLLAEMGAAIGRLVYGVDALEDLADDQRAGAFNPCLVDGKVEPSRLAACLEMIEDAFTNIQGAIAQLPWQRNQELLENVLVQRQRMKAQAARETIDVPQPTWWETLMAVLLQMWVLVRGAAGDSPDDGEGDDIGRRRKRKRQKKKTRDRGSSGAVDGDGCGCCFEVACCDCDLCSRARDRDCCDIDLS
ncbi:MAG: DUF5685 family protein, partial [Myxococcota bacterium]